jgi:hypothetical protein
VREANMHVPAASQLSFEALLSDGAKTNLQRKQDRIYGHLPATLEAALPFYRDLLQRHHDAMMTGDAKAVRALRQEAHDLAYKLNDYQPGILADDDAPGCVLEKLAAAKTGEMPLWGQAANFEIQHGKMRVGIKMDGLFGIGATAMTWLGFSAHAIEKNKPFLSDTGYRSFLGVGGGSLEPGIMPDTFVKAVIAAHVDRDLKGKLMKIIPLVAARGTQPQKKHR